MSLLTKKTYSIYVKLSSTLMRMSTRIINDKSRDLKINYLDGKENGIAVLGLNRHETRNAFSRKLVDEFSSSLSILRNDDKIRVLIIRSLVPNIFCAGADLRERAKMDNDEDVEKFVSSLRNLMNDVEYMPIPVISAIDGAALGGGLELALASDIRTTVYDAKIGLVETKLAIIPGAGGTQRLPRLIGPSKAKELIFTSRIFDGKEAENMGIVNCAVEQNNNGDGAYQAALNIAREILPNGPIGVRMAKAAITRGFDVPIHDGMKVEKECYGQLLNTRDRIEGLAAFAAKRVPIYQGC